MIAIFFASLFGNESSSWMEKYDPIAEIFTHQKQTFQTRLKDLASIPTASIGTSPTGREILLLDPLNSPFLEEAFLTFRKKIHSTSSKEILNELSDFIMNELFYRPWCSEVQVRQFILDWQKKTERSELDFVNFDEHYYIPIILLEDFAKAKIGVCRHIALVVGYFCDCLIQEGLLHGKTHFMREKILSDPLKRRHAWIVFQDEENQCTWHLDPLWNYVKNCNDPEDYQELVRSYDQTIIDRELKL